MPQGAGDAFVPEIMNADSRERPAYNTMKKIYRKKNFAGIEKYVKASELGTLIPNSELCIALYPIETVKKYKHVSKNNNKDNYEYNDC